MKFEHDTVLQEYGVDRKPDIRQFHKLPGIHKEPKSKPYSVGFMHSGGEKPLSNQEITDSGLR